MLGALVAMAVCAFFIHQSRRDSLLTNVCVTVALAAGGFGLTKYVLYRRMVRVSLRIPRFRPARLSAWPSHAVVAEEKPSSRRRHTPARRKTARGRRAFADPSCTTGLRAAAGCEELASNTGPFVLSSAAAADEGRNMGATL